MLKADEVTDLQHSKLEFNNNKQKMLKADEVTVLQHSTNQSAEIL